MRNAAILLAVGIVAGCKPSTADIPITLTVDTHKTLGAISPYIYGTCQPDWGGKSKDLTIVRMGGNRTTAYNWETNASNAGSDWHFQNDGMFKGNSPGEAMLKFTQDAFAHDAAVVMTVPCAGYVSADEKGDGDVRNTANWLSVRFHKSYAHKPGPLSMTPDLNDDAVYEDEFVNFLEKSVAKPHPPLWFALDNEPDLWSGTHKEIWPQKPTYAQISQIDQDYAQSIKAVAPNTKIFGPVSYGWNGFQSFQDAPDANGRNFLGFYLSEFAKLQEKTGKRYLDVLDLHWYPEARGGGKRITESGTDPALLNARLQAFRSLYDKGYTEKSWITDNIHQPIALIPRVNDLIQSNYPGTLLGFTEWDFGGGSDITGGVASADVLGTFGRLAVFMATHWDESKDTYTYAGFAMYRDFDGQGGHFGDVGVATTDEAPERVSVYASTSSKDPNVVTIVVVNHTLDPQRVKLALDGEPSFRTVEAFQLDSTGPAPHTIPAPAYHESGMLLSLPGPSVITVRLTK
jgi:hypothetical protein